MSIIKNIWAQKKGAEAPNLLILIGFNSCVSNGKSN